MDFKSDRGASLILVSVLIVIILISSSALMLTTSQSVTISRLAIHRNQSLMNARDGVQLAEQQAQQLWPEDPQSFVTSMNSYLDGLSQNGAPFTASLSQDGGAGASSTSLFTLRVTGEDQPYQETLQVSMKAAKAAVQDPVFQYVAYSKDSMYEVGKPAITGKILIHNKIFQWNTASVFLHKWPNWHTWEGNAKSANKTYTELTRFFSDIKNSPDSANNTITNNFPNLLPSPYQKFMQTNQSILEQTATQAGSHNHPSLVINESNPLPISGGYISRPKTSYFVIKSNQTVNGPLYIDGSLVIEPGVTLTVNGPLYVNGDLVVNGILQSSDTNNSSPQKVFVANTSWLSPSQDLNRKLVLVSQGDIVVMPPARFVHGDEKVTNTQTNINAFLVSGGSIVLSTEFGYKGEFANAGQDGYASLTLHGGIAAQGNIYLIDNAQGNDKGGSSAASGSGSRLHLIYDPSFLQNAVIAGLPATNASGAYSLFIKFTQPTTVTG